MAQKPSGVIVPTLDEIMIELDRKRCARSLSEFIKAGWHVLEPARPYKHGWHIDCVSDHLEAVTAGQISRLLINVPPGTMKSMACGVFFPAWEWGPKALPHMRFMGTSYKDSLAIRDNVKTRRLVTSKWYQDRWGDQFAMIGDQNTKTKFENDKTGFREAMAFNSMTGSRGDRVLLDDPLSVQMAKSDVQREEANDTFKEALPTRLNDPESSAIIVIMQRLNEGDVSGTIMASDFGYEHVMLPMEFEPERRCYSFVKPTYMNAKAVQGRYDREKHVWRFDKPASSNGNDGEQLRTVYSQDPRKVDGELLFPERFPKTVVERDKKIMGSYASAGQFQQRPAPREGGMFKRNWFNTVKEFPVGTKFLRGWDLAGTENKTSPFTAGVKIGRQPDGRFIVANVVRDQLSPGGVERLIVNTAAADDAKGTCEISLPQDPGQAGKAQVRYLVKQLAGHNVRFSPESGDKITRAEPFSAQAEAGNVDILAGVWNEAYLDELCIFPNGKFADQVDASSRAFNELSGRPTRTTSFAAPREVK